MCVCVSVHAYVHVCVCVLYPRESVNVWLLIISFINRRISQHSVACNWPVYTSVLC